MIMKLMDPELRFLVLGWVHRVNMKQSFLTTNRQWIKAYKLIKWLGARARVPLPFVVPSSLVLTLERRLVTILRVCMNFEKKNHFNYQIKHKYNVDFHFKIVICLQYFSVHNKHFTLLFIVFFKCLLIMHLSYYLSFSTNIFSSKKHCCVDCNVLHVENFCVYVKRAVTSRQSTQT